MEDARSNSTGLSRVESIAAEHEQVDSQEDFYAERCGEHEPSDCCYDEEV